METYPVVWERWRELLGWVDGWFDPEAASRHDFDREEREAFVALVAAWQVESDKIAALESVTERFGEDRVVSVVRKLCADETAAYWRELAAREGRTLDDLLRLLWGPLPQQGFDFTFEKLPDGVRAHVVRCPMADLAADLEVAGYPAARRWMYEIVCSTDFHVPQAFEQPLSFERSKTLMQGADHCNHRYVLAAPRPDVVE
jgi:hypothetical protein